MIKRKEMIFVAICIRQIGLSTRYYNETDCIEYLFSKKQNYYLAIIILKRGLSYSPNFLAKIYDLIFRRKKLGYFDILLSYKLLNEFYNYLELKKCDEDYILNEINKPLRYLYDLYSSKLSFSERKFIDKVESYGQNTNVFFRYYTIEELISKFHLQNIKSKYFIQ